MFTAINLYNAEYLHRDAWGLSPSNIGEFLEEHLGNILLCDNAFGIRYKGNPIVLRLGKKLYEFDWFHIPHTKNVLERSVKSYDWSKLIKEETLIVTPSEVTEYAKTTKMAPNVAAQHFLEQKVSEKSKEIAIFANKEKKLMLFMKDAAHRNTFVEKESALYSDLLKQMLTV